MKKYLAWGIVMIGLAAAARAADAPPPAMPVPPAAPASASSSSSSTSSSSATAAPEAAPEPAPEVGQAQSTIVAVVNDDIISSRDVEGRMALALATTHLTDTPETRERIRPQIIRALIDETLEIQEAAKNGITPTEDDIKTAIKEIEQQRGVPEGTLVPEMLSRGVPQDAIDAQVRAEVAWTKLVGKKLRPNIHIGDAEVDRERARQQITGGESEVQIALLTLPVDKPEDEEQVKALAGKLVSEIRGGAPFESVARELASASADSVAPFWVPETQLDPVVASAVKGIQPGGVAEPARTLQGYVIVRLVGRRGAAAEASAGAGPSTLTEVVVKDILLRLAPDASAAETQASIDIGREVEKSPGDCQDPGIAGIPNLEDYGMAVKFRRDRLDALPDSLRSIVEKLPVGGVSDPYASKEGIRLFMLCERVESSGQLADREETVQRLYRQKIALEAEKYLRKLRRAATVDVRETSSTS